MAQRPQLPEIVWDSELSTTFQSSITIHTKPSSRRNALNQERWRHVKILGHGGYGEVWLQRRESSGSPKLRALKHIRISDRDSGPRGYARELEALAKFSQDRYNEFFVKFYGWYEYNGFLHIATEFCEHGDLRAYLKNVGRLPEDQAQDIAAQVLGGLVMMHKAKFAHRDIKPANILIKSKPPDEWWVKVCDLGLSKRTEGVPGSTTVRGTPGFMAPEIAGFHDDPRSVDPCLADMWCFGETVFQMLTGSGTFSNLASLAHYSKGDVEFPAGGMKEANASDDAVDFVKSLMKVNPNERLEAANAQDHPWMTSFQNQVQDLQESGPSEHHHHQETGPSYLFSPDQSTEASAAWTDLPSSGSITEASVAKYSRSDQLTEASAAWTTMENQASWPTPVTSPSLDTNVEQISRNSPTEIGMPPSRASEKVTDLFVTKHGSREADTETLKPKTNPKPTIVPTRPRLPGVDFRQTQNQSHGLEISGESTPQPREKRSIPSNLPEIRSEPTLTPEKNALPVIVPPAVEADGSQIQPEKTGSKMPTTKKRYIFTTPRELRVKPLNINQLCERMENEKEKNRLSDPLFIDKFKRPRSPETSRSISPPPLPPPPPPTPILVKIDLYPWYRSPKRRILSPPLPSAPPIEVKNYRPRRPRSAGRALPPPPPTKGKDLFLRRVWARRRALPPPPPREV